MLRSARVAKIDQSAVAHVLGDEAAAARRRFGDCALERRNNDPHVFRIEPGGKFSRPDKIAKQDGDLTTLRILGGLPMLNQRQGASRDGAARVSENRDSVQKPPPVAYPRDAEVPQIFGGQLWQELGVDPILPKADSYCSRPSSLSQLATFIVAPCPGDCPLAVRAIIDATEA
jgi:hypothetical protein